MSTIRIFMLNATPVARLVFACSLMISSSGCGQAPQDTARPAPTSKPHANTLLKLEKTGNTTDVINGSPTNEIDHPWLVALAEIKPGGRETFLCAGTLLDKNWILTAAHCVKPDNKLRDKNSIAIMLGLRSLTDIDKPTYRADVWAIYAHPDWKQHPEQDAAKRPVADYDIAIIKIKENQQIKKNVSFVNLPESDIVLDGNPDIWIYGWGSTTTGGPTTDTPQSGYVYAVSPDECQKSYNDTNPRQNISQHMLCAWRLNNQKQPVDTCNGDSGGPALVFKTDKVYIVGVINGGAKNCGGAPGIYAKVPRFADWIRDTLKN